MIDSLATAKRLFAAAGLLAVAAVLLVASQARAADSVYWADF